MTLWKVSYDGGCLGGVAIVKADTPDDALDELRKDPRSMGVFNPVVKRILLIENVAQVLYNDNGDA